MRFVQTRAHRLTGKIAALASAGQARAADLSLADRNIRHLYAEETA